ncbi:MAG: 5-formyltetrahydrofolate cyclo-ligase [Bauldia sp.]|jgi:5-formyltetrahydrofolate cyclo-ligase|nr:5-formyltetrahydrofolate cyclo-ligase [Bauldia sp.]
MTDRSIPDQKRVLRAAALARRDALEERVRAEASASIVARLGPIVAETPPTVLAGFAPIRSEADVMPFLHAVRANHVPVALPRLSGGGIVFRSWRPGTELVPGVWGIREPPEEAPLATPDLVLVPLAAFDAEGNRLGYGKGHYDRALTALREAGFSPRLVGVAFAVQEVEAIPTEPFDVRLDAVVTEDGIRSFAPTA